MRIKWNFLYLRFKKKFYTSRKIQGQNAEQTKTFGKKYIMFGKNARHV